MPFCITVAVVLSLTAPTKSQQHLQGNDSFEFPMPAESNDQDFVVKFKGEMISWKNITQLLHQHKIKVQEDRKLFAKVLEQKTSSAQSCEKRCFLEERRDKTCYCDRACRTFGDCCLDFYSRCSVNGSVVVEAPLQNVTCGDTDASSWSGAIVKSSCDLSKNQSAHDCQAVQQLNMTLQKELPVFSRKGNVTYRSIACAICNNERDLSFWGLNIECDGGSLGASDIQAVKRFVMENKCKWRYTPLENLKQCYKSCVLHDTLCGSNPLPVMSIVKELCSSYSMAFTVDFAVTTVKYRNPHCALCNPKGKSEPTSPSTGPIFPPWSILLDVSSNIVEPKEPKKPQPTPITKRPVPVYNLTSQLFNCSSNKTNCTVTLDSKTCQVVTQNHSTLIHVSLDKFRVMLITAKQLRHDEDVMKLQGNIVYILCPGHQDGEADRHKLYGDPALIYITFIGTLLSIISLCFLLGVYLSVKELRNLPGKCLINLSLALLCYQTIFLGASKSAEIVALCKVLAIFLHFFILAAFSWMSVMAYDTASTFSKKGGIFATYRLDPFDLFTVAGNTRRQPSDIRKTFIKYCILGWGLPAVMVVLCSVLDFTGTFHFGYGNSTYCWLSDKTAMIVAMVTPVSLAVVFNTMCLTKNIYAIHHLQQAASLATNNNSRASLTLICIKLTAVMGLTWILGLVANWKQTAFLWYPSTVLNSMQGFFIALCFTTTKRVRGLLKKEFYKRCHRAAESQTSVTRDQRTGNTDVESTSGSHTINLKCLSRNKASQSP